MSKAGNCLISFISILADQSFQLSSFEIFTLYFVAYLNLIVWPPNLSFCTEVNRVNLKDWNLTRVNAFQNAP